MKKVGVVEKIAWFIRLWRLESFLREKTIKVLNFVEKLVSMRDVPPSDWFVETLICLSIILTSDGMDSKYLLVQSYSHLCLLSDENTHMSVKFKKFYVLCICRNNFCFTDLACRELYSQYKVSYLNFWYIFAISYVRHIHLSVHMSHTFLSLFLPRISALSTLLFITVDNCHKSKTVYIYFVIAVVYCFILYLMMLIMCGLNWLFSCESQVQDDLSCKTDKNRQLWGLVIKPVFGFVCTNALFARYAKIRLYRNEANNANETNDDISNEQFIYRKE